MLTRDQARSLQGTTLHGVGGERLGTVDTLYADRADGQLAFATVHLGLVGGRVSFVPLAQAELRGDDVVVPYDRDLVASAPAVDPDAELSPEEEDRLLAHYGLAGSGGVAAGPADAAPGGHDSSAPGTDAGDPTGPGDGTGEGATRR